MKLAQSWRSSRGVGVVKTTEDRSRDNTLGRLAAESLGDRRVSKRLVTSTVIVVADELDEDRAEVSFAEDDQVVEEFTAKRTVQSWPRAVPGPRKGVIQRTFGVNCVYGQLKKTWRKDRITKVERTLVIGSKWRLRGALLNSEDSTKLNTSFIERLNLTVRQGSAYLGRRTACHSRSEELLGDHLELRRCHYNFIRPHRALRFGPEIRTPAMQAGLARRRLSFRDIFLSEMPRVPSRMFVTSPESPACVGFGWSRAA